MSAQVQAIKALVERLPTEGRAAVAAASHLRTIHSLAEKVVQLKANPDPMKSDLANGQDVEAARKRLDTAITSARTQINTALHEERKELDAAQIKRADLRPDEYAAEIRTVFRGLNDEQRSAFMKDAIERRDAPTVAAIALAPIAVTGLSADRAAAYRTAYLHRAAPMDRSSVDAVDSITDAALRTAIMV